MRARTRACVPEIPRLVCDSTGSPVYSLPCVLQVDLDGSMTSLFDAFEDTSAPQTLKLAQKLGGDPFEDTPKARGRTLPPL